MADPRNPITVFQYWLGTKHALDVGKTLEALWNQYDTGAADHGPLPYSTVGISTLISTLQHFYPQMKINKTVIKSWPTLSDAIGALAPQREA